MSSVAIDGPVGSGKSTIAREVARALGFDYLDTGALYRAIGWYALERGETPEDTAAVDALLSDISLDVSYEGERQKTYVNSTGVTDLIRTPRVSLAASAVSSNPAVRAFLLQAQRDMAEAHDIVMDGRDIGTVVLPNANVKIFLTASPEERAKRRFEELQESDPHITFDEVLRDLIRRDEQDSRRAAAPLRPAEDAVVLDTTGNELSQSIEQVLTIVRERLPR